MQVIVWMSSGFDTHFTSEHLIKAIIKSLVLAGHQVHIIQMNQGGSNPELPEDLQYDGITSCSIQYVSPDKSSFIKRYISEAKWHLKCKRLLQQYKDSDALFLQSTTVGGFALAIARRILGKKAIISFNVQDIFPYNAVYSGKIKKNSLVFKTLSFLQRIAYKKADHIITISEDMKDTLVLDGVKPEKISVIYNWSFQDDLYTNINTSLVSHIFNSNYFNIVYAGNIGVMQNVDVIIEAAKLMKNNENIWFHIIGNGVCKNRLKEKALEYGINNISFWPMQPPELAPAIYSVADVNLIPLVKNVYKTALPSKTAVCFACQKPIVFAIGSSCKFGQKVKSITGCPIVSSDNPLELVDVITKIKNGTIQCDTAKFFTEHMNKTKNSQMYSEIITRR